MPQDKALHVIAGMVIFAILQFISIPIALTGVLIAAVGKEAYDYFHKESHTPEPLDTLATIAGGMIGWLCSL